MNGPGQASPTLAIDAQLGVRVRVHPALCEGWGNCARFASAVYSLDGDGHVDLHLLEVPAELAADARLGAEVCPARAISIIGLQRHPS